jgi:hypothetical protein
MTDLSREGSICRTTTTAKNAAFGINPSVAIMMLDHGGRK